MITGGWAWNQTQELEESKTALENQQEQIEAESDKAKKALSDFQNAEAEKVSAEVDDILRRARNLQEKGYENPSESLLLDAQKLLETYQENPLLEGKKQEIETLLAEYPR